MNNVNANTIKKKFKDVSDFSVQIYEIEKNEVSCMFLENLVNKTLLANSIIDPLHKITEEFSPEFIKTSLNLPSVEVIGQVEDITKKILAGYIVLIPNNEQKAVCVPCQGWEKRSIQEPPTAAVLKGPREGFTEDINTNLSLIRKRLRTSDLKTKEIVLGKYTNTKIVVCYISTIADKEVVKQIFLKLKKIDIDGFVDSFAVARFLTVKKSSLFKQIGNSEKPDVIVSKLLEGRVAVVVNGSPIVLTIPFILFEDFQSADDYYTHPLKATMSRFIRVFGIILAIGLPGIYVALQSFHYALLPIDFLISLQSSIMGLSFPPLIEILFVLFLFEILNEASLRMPKYLGLALSVVGALVLGDTAVQAGIISPPAVIMVAISGITLYTVPDEVSTASVLRVFFTFVGGIAGFYGLMMAFLTTTGYLMTFDNYGSPYLAPYAPIIDTDKKDALFKQTVRKMVLRPKSIPNVNKVRLKNGQGN